MHIRDRIKELRRVKASRLRPHPKNWRTHPTAQQDALRGVLAEIGFAGALLARELPDGSLELIDGHLRAETTPDADVPVLVLDLDEKEAAKLLALHDPLAAMAESNDAVLADLLAQVETESDAIQTLLDRMLAEPGNCPSIQPEDRPDLRPSENETVPFAASTDAAEVAIPETFQVVVECRNEAEQQTVYERLTREGYPCKLLML